MTRADLAAMLRECQMRNINRNLTGLLLRVDDRFLQYIEGPESAVLHLWSNLLSDGRHVNLECHYREPIHRRLFMHWSMAFSDLTSPTLRLAPSNDLLERALQDPVPTDERGHAEDVFHRFWSDCATALPR